MDVTNLQFPDNSVDEIWACHLIEHISPHVIKEVLVSWLDILKPNGKLIMEMPNLEEICKKFVSCLSTSLMLIINCLF